MPGSRAEAAKTSSKDNDSERLPLVACAVQGCVWNKSENKYPKIWLNESEEHPLDEALARHVRTQHATTILACVAEEVQKDNTEEMVWAIYKKALEIKAGDEVPIANEAVDRRVIEYTMHLYNDENIKSLICFNCACRKLCTGGIRSEINFFRGQVLLEKLPAGSFTKNYAMHVFEDRCMKAGSPLHPRGTGMRSANFADWNLTLHESVWKEGCSKEIEALKNARLLCCPEDQRFIGSCVETKKLCKRCEVPVCKYCWQEMMQNRVVNIGLINDNWYGYVENWIYEAEVTRMEKTMASPYWTGLMLYCIGMHQPKRKTHLFENPLYQAKGRIAFKGQMFSAPMDWRNVMQQVQALENKETQIALPITGEILATRVRVFLSSGEVDVNEIIKQATVRKNVVV